MTNRAGCFGLIPARSSRSPCKGPLAGSRIQAVAKDGRGQIWLGTSQGLAVWRGDRFEPVELPGLDAAADVTDLAASRDGGLWVCRANYWPREDHGGALGWRRQPD